MVYNQSKVNPTTFHLPLLYIDTWSWQMPYNLYLFLVSLQDWSDSLDSVMNMILPENLCMPASEALLSIFITTQGDGSISKGTICQWVSGLKLWHQINDAPWLGRAILERSIQGASNFAPPSSITPKCDPVSMLHLQALRQHLNLTNSFDIAVFAVACITFWSCSHLGELLVNSTFDPKQHVSHSTSIRHSIASNKHSYITLHIPHSKMKPMGDSIHITDSGCSCSATVAFDHHLASNTSIPADTPLFTFETAGGSWVPLHRTWFLDCC